MMILRIKLDQSTTDERGFARLKVTPSSANWRANLDANATQSSASP